MKHHHVGGRILIEFVTDLWHYVLEKGKTCICHLSNVQNPYNIPLTRLVNKDPYSALL